VSAGLTKGTKVYLRPHDEDNTELRGRGRILDVYAAGDLATCALYLVALEYAPRGHAPRPYYAEADELEVGW
jgi:hypothetical protein